MGSTSPQIKNFIATSYEYQRKKTDRNLMQVQRQLQILSVVSDLHVFEPTCMETLEFYICLEKLLTSADGKSPLAWKIITLFAHLCQSQNIRVALRDDLKLVPVLCDFLLSSKFSKDKTLKLLQLIEVVSYKIKIPHAEAWVITLIQHLSELLKIDNSNDLFSPSLSILANLCRFNPPALACLRNHAFTKPIVQCLIDINNPSNKERLLAAEMMLYLHQDFSRNGRNYAEEQVARSIECILQAACDGFAENDVASLQLATDVFAEFSACPSLEEKLREPDYSSFVQGTMQYLTPESPESTVEIFLNLLYHIIDLDQPSMQPLYEDIFVKVMNWLAIESCILPALRILRALIMVENKFVDSQYIQEFISAIVVSLDMDEAMHLSPQKLHLINSILILVEELCNHDTSLRMKLAMTFQVSKFSNLLKLVLGIGSASKNNETIICSFPEVSINSTWRDLEFTAATKRVSKTEQDDRMSQVVVSIMSVVKLLGSHNGDFIIEYEQMMSNPMTMKHLVRCERSNNPELIAKALTVLSKGNIPSASMQALVNAVEESNKSNIPNSLEQTLYARGERKVIPFSPDLEVRIERMIERLTGTVEKLELKDIGLTAVMEMYEYKLATMVHAEETLQNALAAADSRYRQTHLAHLQAQAQTDQLRKMLNSWEERILTVQQEKKDVEESIEKIQKSYQEVRETMINEKTTLERECEELRGNLKKLKAFLESREENIKRLQRQVQDSHAEIKSLQQVIGEEQNKITKLQTHNKKLEDELKKGGKDYENLEKECNRLEKCLAEVKKENSELELLIHSHEQAMAAKETELEQISKSYGELKRIQDLIHNMSSGKVSYEKVFKST
ncbi:protein CIP2A-like [Palaemon carinicauda]|uniref:protein CIP2A-like n=1 Tax=Palaemon carinicauda TaxID=392227 RepID=UPI0035B61948